MLCRVCSTNTQKAGGIGAETEGGLDKKRAHDSDDDEEVVEMKVHKPNKKPALNVSKNGNLGVAAKGSDLHASR